MTHAGNASPQVSVLMTAYNREKYIGQAIESILHSTFADYELIIVDDCSNDNTYQIAESYSKIDSRIRLFRNEANLGDYPNRNRAASLARGKYIKYVDSDDLIYEQGLQLFFDSMESSPGAAVAFSSRKWVDDHSFPLLLEGGHTFRMHFFRNGFLDIGPSGVMIRKDAFERYGPFTGKRMIGDAELWMKIALHEPVLLIEPDLIYWREHGEQEYKAGIRDSIYVELVLSLIVEVVSDPRCALTAREKKEVIGYYKNATLRGLVKMALFRGRVSNALRIFLKSRFTFIEFFHSVFFIPRMRKNLKSS